MSFDVELLRYSSGKREVVPWSESGTVLDVGNEIALRFTNEGGRAADVTVLHIDQNYDLEAVFPETDGGLDNRLPPKKEIQRKDKSLYTDHLDVTPEGKGVHFFVVMAVKGEGEPVNFRSLANLAPGAKSLPTRGDIAESDIGTLLEALYDQDGSKVGLKRKTFDDFVVKIYRWEIR